MDYIFYSTDCPISPENHKYDCVDEIEGKYILISSIY